MSNRHDSERAGPPGYVPTGPPGHPRHRADAPPPVNSARANKTWVGPYVATPGMDEQKVLKEYYVYAHPEDDHRPHAVFTSAPTSPAGPPLKKQDSFSSLRSIKRPIGWLRRMSSSSSSSSKKVRVSSETVPISAPHIRGDDYLATLAAVHGSRSTEFERAHLEAQTQQRGSPMRRQHRLQQGSPPIDQTEIDYLASYRKERARHRDHHWAIYLHGETAEESEKSLNIWSDSVNTFLPHERSELHARAADGHKPSVAQWNKLRQNEQAVAKERVDLRGWLDDEPESKPARLVKTFREGAINLGAKLHLYGEPDRMTFSDSAPPGTMDKCSVCGREPLGILSRNGKCRSCK